MTRKWWIAAILALMLLLAGFGMGCLVSMQQTPQSISSPGSSAALGLVLLNGERGVYVLAVSEDSIASLAGIQPGDCILQADGQAVPDTDALNNLLQQHIPQQLTIFRQENLHTLALPRN